MDFLRGLINIARLQNFIKKKFAVRKQSGSITVEAAFLLPFVMIIFLLMIWLSLYLHDRLLISNAIQRLSFKGKDYIVYGTDPKNDYLPRIAITDRGLLYAVSKNKTKEQKLEEWVRKSLDGKLFLFHENEIYIDKSGCYLKIRSTFQCPEIPVFSIFLPKTFYEITTEQSFFCTVREELTRAGSVLLKLWQ